MVLCDAWPREEVGSCRAWLMVERVRANYGRKGGGGAAESLVLGKGLLVAAG